MIMIPPYNHDVIWVTILRDNTDGSWKVQPDNSLYAIDRAAGPPGAIFTVNERVPAVFLGGDVQRCQLISDAPPLDSGIGGAPGGYTPIGWMNWRGNSWRGASYPDSLPTGSGLFVDHYWRIPSASVTGFVSSTVSTSDDFVMIGYSSLVRRIICWDAVNTIQTTSPIPAYSGSDRIATAAHINFTGSTFSDFNKSKKARVVGEDADHLNIEEFVLLNAGTTTSLLMYTRIEQIDIVSAADNVTIEKLDGSLFISMGGFSGSMAAGESSKVFASTVTLFVNDTSNLKTGYCVWFDEEILRVFVVSPNLPMVTFIRGIAGTSLPSTTPGGTFSNIATWILNMVGYGSAYEGSGYCAGVISNNFYYANVWSSLVKVNIATGEIVWSTPVLAHINIAAKPPVLTEDDPSGLLGSNMNGTSANPSIYMVDETLDAPTIFDRHAPILEVGGGQPLDFLSARRTSDGARLWKVMLNTNTSVDGVDLPVSSDYVSSVYGFYSFPGPAYPLVMWHSKSYPLGTGPGGGVNGSGLQFVMLQLRGRNKIDGSVLWTTDVIMSTRPGLGEMAVGVPRGNTFGCLIASSGRFAYAIATYTSYFDHSAWLDVNGVLNGAGGAITSWVDQHGTTNGSGDLTNPPRYAKRWFAEVVLIDAVDGTVMDRILVDSALDYTSPYGGFAQEQWVDRSLGGGISGWGTSQDNYPDHRDPNGFSKDGYVLNGTDAQYYTIVAADSNTVEYPDGRVLVGATMLVVCNGSGPHTEWIPCTINAQDLTAIYNGTPGATKQAHGYVPFTDGASYSYTGVSTTGAILWVTPYISNYNWWVGGGGQEVFAYRNIFANPTNHDINHNYLPWGGYNSERYWTGVGDYLADGTTIGHLPGGLYTYVNAADWDGGNIQYFVRGPMPQGFPGEWAVYDATSDGSPKRNGTLAYPLPGDMLGLPAWFLTGVPVNAFDSMQFNNAVYLPCRRLVSIIPKLPDGTAAPAPDPPIGP